MQRHYRLGNYFDLDKSLCIFIGLWCFIVFSVFSRFLIMIMISIYWLRYFIFSFSWHFTQYCFIICFWRHNWSCDWYWMLFIYCHNNGLLSVYSQGMIIINTWLCEGCLFWCTSTWMYYYNFYVRVHVSWLNWPLSWSRPWT